MKSRASEQERAGGAAAQPVKRRSWVLGVGAAGAAVLAVRALPAAAPLVPAAVAPAKVIDTAGGYRLTAHVQRYYDSARS